MRFFSFKDKPETWFGNNGDMAVTPNREYAWIKQNGVWGDRIDMSVDRIRQKHAMWLWKVMDTEEQKQRKFESFLLTLFIILASLLAMGEIIKFCRTNLGS